MNKPSGDVIVLGAGFSKAVHKTFPVLPELAERILSCLKQSAAQSAKNLVAELERATTQPKKTFRCGDLQSKFDFESWLSRIAVDQPHLSQAENYARRALFAETAVAIREVLLQAMNDAIYQQQLTITWPYQLLRVLDVRQATVITMNYDTIIETLTQDVLSPWRWDSNGAHAFYAADLFRGLPPTDPPPDPTITLPDRGLFYDGYQHVTPPSPRPSPKTIRLIKLHGSIDWYAARNDPTGSTLRRWEAYGDTELKHPPGCEPFLIPPHANKTAYFDNAVLRELWNQAREALEEAGRVTLVGYSLPATDTTFGGLLADTLGGRDNFSVGIADKHPYRVARRLHTLGIRVDQTSLYSGQSAVKSWTESLLDEQARSAAKCLRNLANRTDANQPIWYASISVMVPDNPGTDVLQYVEKGHLEDDTFVLDLLPSDQERVACQVSQFLPPSEATRVAADLGDGRCLMLDYRVIEPQRGGDVASITFLPSVGHLDNRS